jgi:acetolactate synthase I/III small subunit
MMKTYTISVFSEDVVGLLNRVTIILTRRKINIENIITSETEVKGIYRYTIVVTVTEAQVIKLVKLIEKQVEVMKAFYFTDVDLVSREMALYKLSNKAIVNNEEFIKTINRFGAKIVSISFDYVVVEKSGSPAKIKRLFDALEPFEILEFSKSGKVAVSKPMRTLKHYLDILEENSKITTKKNNKHGKN